MITIEVNLNRCLGHAQMYPFKSEQNYSDPAVNYG